MDRDGADLFVFLVSAYRLGGDFLQEVGSGRRRWNAAGEHSAEAWIIAINGVSRIVVLFDDCAFEGESTEDALGAGVAEDFGIQLPVCAGYSLTAYGTGSDGAFATQLELAGEQMLHAAIVHDQHDEVDIFTADLKHPASAAAGDKGSRAHA